MDVIQAEEALDHVTRIAAGNGLMKRHEYDRIMNAWRRRARRAQPRRGRTLGVLAEGLGIVWQRDRSDKQS